MATIIGSTQSMGCTTVRPWSMLEPGFCSFFALQAWHNMDGRGGGQNTAIAGKMLGNKAKNSVKYSHCLE